MKKTVRQMELTHTTIPVSCGRGERKYNIDCVTELPPLILDIVCARGDWHLHDTIHNISPADEGYLRFKLIDLARGSPNEIHAFEFYTGYLSHENDYSWMKQRHFLTCWYLYTNNYPMPKDPPNIPCGPVDRYIEGGKNDRLQFQHLAKATQF